MAAVGPGLLLNNGGGSSADLAAMHTNNVLFFFHDRLMLGCCVMSQDNCARFVQGPFCGSCSTNLAEQAAAFAG